MSLLSDFRSYGEQKKGLETRVESRPCFTGALSFKEEEEEEEEDVLLLHSLGKISQGISLTMGADSIMEGQSCQRQISPTSEKSVFPPENLYFPRAVSELSYPSWVEVLLSPL